MTQACQYLDDQLESNVAIQTIPDLQKNELEFRLSEIIRESNVNFEYSPCAVIRHRPRDIAAI